MDGDLLLRRIKDDARRAKTAAKRAKIAAQQAKAAAERTKTAAAAAEHAETPTGTPSGAHTETPAELYHARVHVMLIQEGIDVRTARKAVDVFVRYLQEM